MGTVWVVLHNFCATFHKLGRFLSSFRRFLAKQSGHAGLFHLVQQDLILDIHAHASLLGTFVVGNAYDDVYRFERHTVFPKILSQICPDFSTENTVYNNDVSKEGTARDQRNKTFYCCISKRHNSTCFQLRRDLQQVS